ncbi:MAG: glutathione S-transferase family protein [Pseudomonadota bacterium]
MPDMSSAVILHNYPQSPVAEKVRIALGIKNLEWHSVEIPRLPPKPMLTQLTGGYRRTPVMQIGADIYCDSLCIISELENRFPQPGLYPLQDAGLAWCLSRWTDGAFFDLVVKVVLGSASDDLPQDFAADRGRLYFGENWADGLKKANAALPHLVSQVRAPFAALDVLLSDGRKFLMGDAPFAIDAQFYYMIWFMRGRWDRGPEFLAQFPALTQWEDRVQEIGHGTMVELSPQDAISIAASTEPLTINLPSGELDPQDLSAGMEVTVSPDVDGGEQPVEGTIVFADTNRVTLHRHDEEAGNLNVHFPRAGYRVDIL